MMSVALAGRVGDDCYSAFVVWQRLLACIECEGRMLHKHPLDLRRDGFHAIYRVHPPRRAMLSE